MKICRKILSVISAAAVFSAMTVSVFANNVTTTVTYDISTGKANVVTSGTATAGKEVTHIVYTGSTPSESSILYLDQATADSNGAFSFNYSVATEKLSDTSVSVVGTDGDPINYESTGTTSTDVAASVLLTVKFSGSVTGVTLKQNDTIATVSASGGTVRVQPGVDVTYTVEGASTYTVNDKQAMGAYRTSYSEDTVVTVASGSSSEGIVFWDKENPNVTYGAVVTNDAVSADVVAYKDPEGTHVDGTGELSEISTSAKTVTFYSTVNTAMIAAARDQDCTVEYGIIFLPGTLASNATLDADNSDAYILPAYYSVGDSEWGICVVDETGTQITNYTARTYVNLIKNGENHYEYGNIVSK